MRVAAALALVALTLGAVPAAGATITADGVSCTLADAIRSANADSAPLGSGCDDGSGDDLIVLDADVVLTTADALASGSSNFDNGIAGLPDVTSVITLQAGLGDTIERDPANLCLSLDPDAFRLLNVASPGQLTLIGLTLRNGCVAGPAGSVANGGGVYTNFGTVLTVNGGSFVGNQARGGDGVGVVGGLAAGGAVYGSGAINMNGTLLEANGALGGSSDTGAGPGSGGAIRVASGTLTLEGCVLRSNLAEGGAYTGPGGNCGFCNTGTASGGAVYVSSPTLALRDSRLSDNAARGGAGGVENGGQANGGALFVLGAGGVIERLLVRDNLARGGDGANGGGAGDGGGLRASGSGSLSVRDSAFISNTARGGASGAGGGLATGGGANLAPTTPGEVRGCSFVGNLARGGDGGATGGSPGIGRGGGAFLSGSGSFGAFTNSTLSGNIARGGNHLAAGIGGDGQGGGLGSLQQVPTLSHVTIAGNQVLSGTGAGGDGAARGGGLYSSQQNVTVDDSLLANNVRAPGGGPSTPQDCETFLGTLTSAGYNLVEAPGGNCSFAAAGDQTGVDPQLRPLADNGCATPLLGGLCPPTHSFPAGSPAADAGSCALSGITIDQRGVARPQQLDVPDADDGCDVGALEADPGSYYTVTPCRMVDTRTPADAPALSSGVARVFLLGGLCAIPNGAAALTLNVTVVAPAANGHLVLYPGDLVAPLASTLNFVAGGTRANNAIVRLATDGSATVAARATLVPGGDVHLILDVTGYFE